MSCLVFAADLDSSSSESELDMDTPPYSPISDEESVFSDSDTEFDLSSDELAEEDLEDGMQKIFFYL